MKTVAFPLLALNLAACALDGDLSEVELLVPGDVELHWDEAYNDLDDGLAAIIPLDIMVYDGETGAPVSDVPVELFVEQDGLFLFEAGAWLPRELDGCVDCVVLWDAYRDEYVEFSVGLDEELATQLEVVSDEDGLVRWALMVDALPEIRAERFDAVSISVTTPFSETAFLLQPI